VVTFARNFHINLLELSELATGDFDHRLLERDGRFRIA
jgi:hypothetical protein